MPDAHTVSTSTYRNLKPPTRCGVPSAIVPIAPSAVQYKPAEILNLDLLVALKFHFKPSSSIFSGNAKPGFVATGVKITKPAWRGYS